MNLQEFLREYPEHEKLKEKFPDLWDYAKEVEVIEWQEDFNVADHNPEVIDEIDFVDMLYRNGMITKEEYERKVKSVSSYASKTLGIAFIEERQVSFRSKRPDFSVVVHELGHCYFEAPDSVWSSVYGGGESILWLIYNDMIEGNEDTVRDWIEMMRLSYEDKDKIMEFLDNFAVGVANKYGLELSKEDRPIVELMKFAGTLTETGLMPHAFFIETIEGLRWEDPFYSVFAKELMPEIREFLNNQKRSLKMS